MSDDEFNQNKAKSIGDELKVDWTHMTVEEFYKALCIEIECDTPNIQPRTSKVELLKAGRRVLKHLEELPNHYKLIQTMADEAAKQTDFIDDTRAEE
jgi:hypothetical protein